MKSTRGRELESLLKLSEARCAKLEYKLQDLLRRVYGPKNERLNPDQRALFGIPAAINRLASDLPPHDFKRLQPRADC